MIADESVAVSCIDVHRVDTASQAQLRDETLEERIAEGFLEIKVGLASVHFLRQGLLGYIRVEIRQHLLELFVGKNPVVDSRQLFRLERTDRVKL